MTQQRAGPRAHGGTQNKELEADTQASRPQPFLNYRPFQSLIKI